jgi:hypothetical protein
VGCEYASAWTGVAGHGHCTASGAGLEDLLKMQRGYPFTDYVLMEALWQTAAWKCSVGEQVGLVEWKESWEEGGVKY